MPTHPGPDALAAYLASGRWADRKAMWLDVNEHLVGHATCTVCDATDDIDLVHKGFDHFGQELYEDLMPLCPTCHHQVTVHLHQAAAGGTPMPYELALTAAVAAARRNHTHT